MTLRSAMAATGMLLLCVGQSGAADLPPPRSAPEPAPSAQEERGIWAAIAYSSSDEKHGFFWGADKRQEARELALKHCQRAGGDNCVVVSVFRNHRHWDDDDRTGFPYHHCGALAVAKEKNERMTAWSAKAAPTRRQAEDQALQACRRTGAQCEVREWVCT